MVIPAKSQRPSQLSPRGFTLIELLIVIAIILILIAIALPNFLEAQIRARVTKARGDMKALNDAEHTFFIDHDTFTDDYLHVNDLTIYSQLTSPVPYIMEYPEDPFWTDQSVAYGQRRYFIGTGNIKVYCAPGRTTSCEGCRAIADPISCTPSSPTYNNMRHPAVCDSMIILSKGPDADDSGGPHPMYPHPLPGISGGPTSGGLQYEIYNATNGTKSDGDLFWFGGAIPEPYKNLSF